MLGLYYLEIYPVWYVIIVLLRWENELTILALIVERKRLDDYKVCDVIKR